MKNIAIAAALLAAHVSAAAAATLDTVKQRGMLVCGVSTGFAGFSAPDSQGMLSGRWWQLVFGIICTAVALYQGYETEATPEGVAYATTRTVVISSLAVLCMDFVLTALMFSTH